MQIFITWSKEPSRKAAELLNEWLPSVVQAATTFMSQADIEAGDRWLSELTTYLEKSNFGILCLTPENLYSPWVLFEAGALSKSVSHSRVVPLLIGLEVSDVPSPVSQFQAILPDARGMLSLVRSINRSLDADRAITSARIDAAFEKFWPELESRLHPIIEQASAARKGTPSQPVVTKAREDREVLEELLGTVRAQAGEIAALRHSIGSAGPFGVYRGPGATPIAAPDRPPEARDAISSGRAFVALQDVVEQDGGHLMEVDFSTNIMALTVNREYQPSPRAIEEISKWYISLGFASFGFVRID